MGYVIKLISVGDTGGNILLDTDTVIKAPHSYLDQADFTDENIIKVIRLLQNHGTTN